MILFSSYLYNITTTCGTTYTPNNNKISWANFELQFFIYNFSHIGLAFLPVWHCVRHSSQNFFIFCSNYVYSYTSVTLLSAILGVFGHQWLKLTNIRLEHYHFGGYNASVNTKKSSDFICLIFFSCDHYSMYNHHTNFERNILAEDLYLPF